MNTQELLEQLTDAYARRDLLNIDKEQARDDAIPEEVEAALADIDLRFSPKLEILDNLIGRLEAQAKESVLSEGKTDSLAARCKQYSRKVASVGIARNWTG